MSAHVRYAHTYPLIDGEYVRVATPITAPITPVTPAAVIVERARQRRAANGHTW